MPPTRNIFSAAVAILLMAHLLRPAVLIRFKIFVAKWSGYDAPGGLWKLAVFFLVLLNLKNIPFVWHLRFFRALVYQVYFQPTSIPPHALFQPIVTSTRTTLMELDYNLHKSNSTYFSDMDISRTHLLMAILRNAIRKTSRSCGTKKIGVDQTSGATEGSKGKHAIALGGITCLFKKEILPYQKYEMWTRILAWDKKWFYVITHLVRPGIVRPQRSILQPWLERQDPGKVSSTRLLNAVHATAIAKYVIKRGRITVPPEQALLDAEMVPRKPEGWVLKPEGLNSTPFNIEHQGIFPNTTGEDWNWNNIEKERLRGMQIAQRFADMDDMHSFFDGAPQGLLGEYTDFLY